MKTAGIIMIVLGCISLMGILLMGGNIVGPVFWIGLGCFLIHKSNKKLEQQQQVNDKAKLEDTTQ